MSTPQRRRSATVPLTVAVVALLFTGVVVATSGTDRGTNRPSGTSTSTGTGQPGGATSSVDEQTRALAAVARKQDGDPLAVGRLDAPVTLVAYSEFQCPYCGRFARDTEPQLVTKYVDRGLLRIEWHDFPYLGEESLVAAKAARAASLQGGFWAFHRELYAHPEKPNSGALTVDRLVALAQQAGLDGPRLRRDMARPEVAEGIAQDFAEGQRIGVSGTPTFLVNGRPIVGAQALEVFEEAIDEALAAR